MPHGSQGLAAQVAVIVSGWPRVSETFAVNELLALRRHGRLARVFATKPGDRSLIQPAAVQLDSLVEVLDPGPVGMQGAMVAKRLIDLDLPVVGVHGYFAHRPTAVAERAAGYLGVGYGFSTHALDARKVPRRELARRARDAAVVITCNTPLADRMRSLGTIVEQRSHGVDCETFAPRGHARRPGPPRLLAVGRLVEKKGFLHLIGAMSRLSGPAILTIVGDGPQRHLLTEAIRQHRVSDRVRLVGRTTHADLPRFYGDADMVVVPSIIDPQGDSDGLPNVVLEAMASGRPVVASRLSGIPSAIRSVGDADDTGVLVPPGDEVALAAAIRSLLGSAGRRTALSFNARHVATRDFHLTACGDDFADLIGRTYDNHSSALEGGRRDG